MEQNGRNFTADKGNFIIRKEDDFIMGEGICLGVNDSIENYYERKYDEEEYYLFCIKYNIPKEQIHGIDIEESDA